MMRDMGVRAGQLRALSQDFTGARPTFPKGSLYVIIEPHEEPGRWRVLFADGRTEVWWDSGIITDELLQEPEQT